jgi:hypothetical protein
MKRAFSICVPFAKPTILKYILFRPPPEAPDVGGEHSTSSAPSLDPNSVDFGRDLRNPSRITPLQSVLSDKSIGE